jgi:hypothetical protein
VPVSGICLERDASNESIVPCIVFADGFTRADQYLKMRKAKEKPDLRFFDLIRMFRDGKQFM